MRRHRIPALIAVVCTGAASAENMSAMRLAEGERAAPTAMQTTRMEEVALGDYWTYELKDEISGVIIQVRKVTVTEVSDREIATRLEDMKSGQSRSIVYDRSWNIVHDWPNRYSPNSGTGFRFPLTLNDEWAASVDEVDRNTGDTWKIRVYSRVTGQENVTTKAGTFATYKVETTQAVQDLQNPTENSEISTRTWFSPDVNHWARRNFVRQEEGLVVRHQTFELIEYGRKDAQ
jgi:hypothetical protein